MNIVKQSTIKILLQQMIDALNSGDNIKYWQLLEALNQANLKVFDEVILEDSKSEIKQS